MAEFDTPSQSKLLVRDSGNHPMGFIEINEGGTVHFTCLVLDVSGVSYYYWPNSSGVLRYGTTAPTSSTQDTAGSTV
jgi:hypothetical protein